MEIRDINIGLCRDILNTRNARLAQREGLTILPQADVEEINIEWGPFSTTAHLNMLKEFLRHFTWPTNATTSPLADKAYVEGTAPNSPAFIIEGEPFFGRWRQAVVSERRQELRPDEVEYFIVLTLRKGFLTAYSASEMRLVRLFDKEGTTDTVDGYPTTDQDGDSVIRSAAGRNPGLVARFQIKNVGRAYVQTVANSLPASLAAATTIDGYTVPTGRTFYKTIADYQYQNDGSATIDVIYADEQFAFNGFRESNTTAEQKLGYLWNVPRQLAEDLSDDWYSEADTAGRSCTASPSGEGGGYLDLLFTSTTGRKQNLTTPWMPIAGKGTGADATLRWRRWHFGWQYTKTEIYDGTQDNPSNDFIDAHDDPIGSDADGSGHAVMARNISIQQRGAFYDIIIIEDSFGTHYNAATPDFTITVPIGTKITRQLSYGWDIRTSELATVKAVYDTSIPANSAAGKSVDFRVTKADDWSFNYVAEITLQSAAITADVNLARGGGVLPKGVSQRVRAWRGVDVTDEDFTDALPIPSRTKRVGVNLDTRDDELSNVKVAEEDVVESTNQTLEVAPAGTTGITNKFHWGIHQADPPSTLTAGPRKRIITGQVTADDSGGISHFALEQQVPKKQPAAVKVGSMYNRVTKQVADDIDEADMPDLSATPGQGYTRRFILNVKAGGEIGYDYELTQRVAKEVSVTTKSKIGDVTVTVAATVKDHQTSAPTSDTVATNGRRRQVLNLGVDDDGLYRWVDVITTIATPGTEGTAYTLSKKMVEDKLQWVIYRRWAPSGTGGVFSWIDHLRKRLITQTISVQFYTSRPSNATVEDVSTNQWKHVEQVFDGLLFALYTVTYNYEDYDTGSLTLNVNSLEPA